VGCVEFDTVAYGGARLPGYSGCAGLVRLNPVAYAKHTQSAKHGPRGMEYAKGTQK